MNLEFNFCAEDTMEVLSLHNDTQYSNLLV